MGRRFARRVSNIDEALRRAKEAAGAKDIRIGGGAATVREYQRKDLVGRFHEYLAIAHPDSADERACFDANMLERLRNASALTAMARVDHDEPRSRYSQASEPRSP